VPGGGDIARLDRHLYDRLRAFDRRHRDERDRVFEWSDGFARTTQWVGVVQVPGLQVEILPKIDVLAGQEARPDTEEAQYEVRRNLLYMLSVSGDVPVRSREVARLAIRHAPLSETLSAIFASRLRQELLLGTERNYMEKEENLRRFKGKLLVAHQTLLNSAHRERFFCRYDEFSDDTPMNRIFKASCRMLLELTHMPSSQEALRHCLLLLDGVADVEIQDADFDRIELNRNNERFEDVLEFCRLLISGRTPTVEAGGIRTFSLLFDMNTVFERFVASFLRRYVVSRLPGVEVFPQAVHHKRHLMECESKGVLCLKPDLLIESTSCRLVMDTKWKLLSPGKRGRGGVSESDLYQLYAYTRRYGCSRSILLYPAVPGLESRDFRLLDADGARSGEEIAIRMIDLHRDLHLESERLALAKELEKVVCEGLQLSGERLTAESSVRSAA
jgi:5-methylcytosine-specific restriction enzyme subunit McrC